jgi:hypothetical protein
MRLVRELATAAALAVGRPALVVDRPVHERVQALAWLPSAGLVVGAVAAAAAAVAARFGSGAAAVLGAGILAVALGPPRRPLLRTAAAVSEALALLAMTPAARTIALVLAPMLARWAVVVQCYGGVPPAGATGVATLAGRARFREFAIASVSALGTTLVLLDAVGLAVAACCALVTVAIRVLAYRRAGRIGDEATLDATSALVETSALVMLASIDALLGR